MATERPNFEGQEEQHMPFPAEIPDREINPEDVISPERIAKLRELARSPEEFQAMLLKERDSIVLAKKAEWATQRSEQDYNAEHPEAVQ